MARSVTIPVGALSSPFLTLNYTGEPDIVRAEPLPNELTTCPMVGVGGSTVIPKPEEKVCSNKLKRYADSEPSEEKDEKWQSAPEIARAEPEAE